MPQHACNDRSPCTGILHQMSAPDPHRARRDGAGGGRGREAQRVRAAHARPRADDPPGRRRLLQRLRARDPRARNPYYNIEGLGIQFVASPRHADMLLVTGPVAKHMAIALKRTYDATPDPKLVVAVGDCGCNGGIFGESYASLRPGRQRDPGRRRGAGLPADADGAAAGHPAGDRPHRDEPRRRHRRRRRRCGRAALNAGAYRPVSRAGPWRRGGHARRERAPAPRRSRARGAPRGRRAPA